MPSRIAFLTVVGSLCLPLLVNNALAQTIQPPASGAYFGAWVNPPGTNDQFPQATKNLETAIGRTLALHMHYYAWRLKPGSDTQSFPDSTMEDDALNGRTPVVTWHCGDSDDNVVAGADDALIENTANAIKAFGHPVFIRWYWEMNLPDANHQNCLGTSGAAGYIKAWRYIHQIFQNQGVTNVTWLWNPNRADDSSEDPMPYYPGDDVVDWIGVDGYDKQDVNDFGPIFSPFYAEFQSKGKPMLISETGECPAEQATYLGLAAAELEGKPNPGGYAFPLVKGFMYFDAVGNYATCAWTLGTGTGGGVDAFGAMGATSYFAPVPSKN
ncbi:glycoside hydrolase family 26 protein [Dyella mobilis]|uniref:GH26 domain-containing protein n=1 Tax=Dyella mobilis TaxID=1849582 RepID=A0ABS2KF64_9GAMM|nr:glycosyl hydrolase [Dyella mobilis]MBM7129505.1 hypothetical protein [Dyella mobilis]GLQ98230.1 hypothetical protein GCM10007863_26500 [Dyella mobilis]